MVTDSSSGDRLSAALELADLGFPVFPCKPGAKTPLSGSHGFQDATTDADQIERWFVNHPRRNLGLATAGLVVIDVDPGATFPGDPDREIELSAAPTAATPRGGLHHYFRQPAGVALRITESEIADHVDTRADGGYAVVSPSIVDDRPYRWITPLDCSPGDLPEPPAWLMELLSPKPPSLSLLIPHNLRTHPGASEGQRNSVLCELVGRHIATSGATPDLPTLAMEWASRCSPPMPAGQVAKSVEGLVRKHGQTASDVKAPPAAGVRMEIISADEVKIEPVEWLWPGRLPAGMLSLISGDPGLGKTASVIDVSARVTAGRDFPDGSRCRQSGNVLFYTLEDSFAHTIVPRFVAAGGIPSRLKLVGAVTRADGSEDILLLDRDLPRLREAIDIIGDIRLLVIDPISACLGPTVNENRNSDVRRILSPLSRLANETGVAIWGISHDGKGADGRKGVHRTLGSIAFVAAARTAWCVVADPDDPDRRLLLAAKNNLAATDGLAYRLAETTVEGCSVPLVEWESAPVRVRLDDLDQTRSDRPGFDEASAWLRANLTEPTPSSELFKLARRDGISRRTLERAKKTLGIVSKPVGTEGKHGGGPWHWFPPPSLRTADNRPQETFIIGPG